MEQKVLPEQWCQLNITLLFPLWWTKGCRWLRLRFKAKGPSIWNACNFFPTFQIDSRMCVLLGLFGQLGLPGPLGLLELLNNKSLLKRCRLMVLFGSELRFDLGFLLSVFVGFSLFWLSCVDSLGFYSASLVPFYGAAELMKVLEWHKTIKIPLRKAHFAD